MDGVKERPILFSGPMVRAILEGRKTQTRRVVNPVGNDDGFVLLDHGNGWWPYRSDDGESSILSNGNETPHSCPYGQPGDRLWVREAHTFLDVTKSAMSRFPLVDGGFGPDVWNLCVEYSDGTENDTFSVEGKKPTQTRERGETRWRPSIHMPRWASRITLEVTAVRVERLQDISREDAIAEGVRPLEGSNGPNYWTVDAGGVHLNNPTAQGAYSMLWDWINGDGSWDKNPWVWIISFHRMEANNGSP